MTGGRSGSTSAALERHLRDHARRYCPDLPDGELRIEFTGSREGRLSSVQRVRVCVGTVERALVVKLPPGAVAAPAHGRARSAPARPRISPLLDPQAKFDYERDALLELERHFDALADPRFGCVRMLDFLPELRAIVMQSAPGTPLRDLLARASRFRGSPRAADPTPAIEAAGAWLRSFHAIPPLPHTRVREASRKEFIESIHRFADFLTSAHAESRLMSRVAAAAEASALECLPRTLPLATSHGDLAPRNILIEPSGRVSVLDTRAAWCAPIYEDIGFFVVALRTPRVQAYSLGLAFGRRAIGRYEEAFLRGYFGEESVPTSRLRLFELQALLDKWSSGTEARVRTPGSGPAAAIRDRAFDRLMRRSIESVTDRIAESNAARRSEGAGGRPS
jgi:hypothetical protein